jgi:hypothetical protein
VAISEEPEVWLLDDVDFFSSASYSEPRQEADEGPLPPKRGRARNVKVPRLFTGEGQKHTKYSIEKGYYF